MPGFGSMWVRGASRKAGLVHSSMGVGNAEAGPPEVVAVAGAAGDATFRVTAPLGAQQGAGSSPDHRGGGAEDGSW